VVDGFLHVLRVSPDTRLSAQRAARSRRRRAARIPASALVIQQGVELGGFGAGVSEPAAYGFDGHAGVDEFGGVGVPELVDVDVAREKFYETSNERSARHLPDLYATRAKFSWRPGQVR
jgi:hypothetical protein